MPVRTAHRRLVRAAYLHTSDAAARERGKRREGAGQVQGVTGRNPPLVHDVMWQSHQDTEITSEKDCE